MKIYYSNWYLNQLLYIQINIDNSLPRIRYKEYNTENGNYDYYTISSTYPSYIKFAFTKKPKWYLVLSEEEKLLEDRYWHYNIKNVRSIVKKLLSQNKLTIIQQYFTDDLFYEWNVYQKDYQYQYQENLIVDNVPEF